MSERRERSDARRHRETITAAAAAELRAGKPLGIQSVAGRAGLSRSTIHRHFGNAAGLERAVVSAAATEAASALAIAADGTAAPLAELRRALLVLAGIGARFGLARVSPDVVVAAIDPVASALAPTAKRVLAAAEMDGPPADWLPLALRDLVARTFRATNGDDPDAATEVIFRALTDRLGRALLVVDAAGGAVAANEAGRSAFGIAEDQPRGSRVAEPQGLRYEDDSAAPPGLHPLTLAVASGQSQPTAIRGLRTPGDLETRWFVVEATALRLRDDDPAPYGIVAAMTDITDERNRDLTLLPQPGTLGRTEPLILDAARALDEVPAHLLPDQLVAEARRLVNVPVALYVVDIDGSRLLRVAGAEEFPDQMEAPLALGPELAPDGMPSLATRLADEMPGAVLAPLWLRGRAVGVLLAAGGDVAALAELAREGAAALELGNGYTDTLDAKRRRKEINPAAEIQQSLLPPRIVRLAAGHAASSMLPAYEVVATGSTTSKTGTAPGWRSLTPRARVRTRGRSAALGWRRCGQRDGTMPAWTTRLGQCTRRSGTPARKTST